MFGFLTESMVEDVSPYPSSGGGGAEGGNLEGFSATPSPATAALPTVSAGDKVFEETDLLPSFVLCRLFTEVAERESSAVVGIPEACALALWAAERMRSNKLGSSEDSTIGVV